MQNYNFLNTTTSKYFCSKKISRIDNVARSVGFVTLKKVETLICVSTKWGII